MGKLLQTKKKIHKEMELKKLTTDRKKKSMTANETKEYNNYTKKIKKVELEARKLR